VRKIQYVDERIWWVAVGLNPDFKIPNAILVPDYFGYYTIDYIPRYFSVLHANWVSDFSSPIQQT